MPLSNFDIEEAARDIPHFRGVFMRDSLPPSIWSKECGVVNLDSTSGEGTHWVAYYKDGPKAIYFDSYGLDPPVEVSRYLDPSRSNLLRSNLLLRSSKVLVQTFQLQGPNDVICGHLCIHVLHELAAGKKFEDIVLSMV